MLNLNFNYKYSGVIMFYYIILIVIQTNIINQKHFYLFIYFPLLLNNTYIKVIKQNK